MTKGEYKEKYFMAVAIFWEIMESNMEDGSTIHCDFARSDFIRGMLKKHFPEVVKHVLEET